MTTAHDLDGVLVVVQGLEALGLAVEKTSRTHWQSQCPNPDHPDSEASLCIDVKPYHGFGPMNVAIRCPVCHWKGSDVCQALGLPVRILFGDHERYRNDRPTYSEPLSEENLGLCQERLLGAPEKLQYLHEHRGLTLATIDKYELGYDDGLDRYVLPVRNARRQLVNFRRYSPGATANKMVNAAGHGSPARLYPLPLPLPPSGSVLVVEGEWDALLARQHLLPAVTGTEGTTWEDSWTRWLAGREVAFAFDCDKAGREGAAKAAAKVAKVAAAVKVIDLGLGDKEDVSDWFLKYGRSKADLLNLIRETPAFFAGGEGQGD